MDQLEAQTYNSLSVSFSRLHANGLFSDRDTSLFSLRQLLSETNDGHYQLSNPSINGKRGKKMNKKKKFISAPTDHPSKPYQEEGH